MLDGTTMRSIEPWIPASMWHCGSYGSCLVSRLTDIGWLNKTCLGDHKSLTTAFCSWFVLCHGLLLFFVSLTHSTRLHNFNFTSTLLLMLEFV